MPAGNCVISFINGDAEGERGVPRSAAVSEGAGMQSSAAATEAACLHCTALVKGQHPQPVLLTSNPTPKSQSPGKTLLMWTLVSPPNRTGGNGLKLGQGRFRLETFFHWKERCSQELEEAVHHPWRCLDVAFRTWLGGGLGGAELRVWLDDLRDLFQPQWLSCRGHAASIPQ